MHSVPSITRVHLPIVAFIACGLICVVATVAKARDAASSREMSARLEEGRVFVLTARAGQVGGSVDVLMAKEGKGVRLRVTADDFPKMNHHWGLSDIPSDVEFTDGALKIELTGSGVDYKPYRTVYYVRPDIRFYVGDDLGRGINGWGRFPSASQHAFRVEVRHRSDSLEIWVDGRFLRRLPLDVAGADLRVEASETAEILKTETVGDSESRRFLPLDISVNRHQGIVSLDNLSLDSDATVGNLPLQPVALDRQVDVGLARWLRESQDSSNFYDPYYKRSAWDNLPETIIFHVPKRFYHTAHVLCVVDPDESPTMAVRIGRYRRKWDGSGATQGDKNVRIDPANPEGIRAIEQVGTVALKRRDGALWGEDAV